MNLSYILGNYKIRSLKNMNDIIIKGIEHNSKRVSKDFIFVAQKGFTVDGHEFIQEAINMGARAIVYDKDTNININNNVVLIKVENATDALAYFSSRYYNIPWNKMNMIGITGTNGKTSISYYIKNIFDLDKKKTALLGTIGAIIDKTLLEMINTTPDSLEIFKLLDKMIENDIEYSIMEVSSHALELKRVEYIDFNVGIFTNLSKDHLDYHETMENYFQSKLKLFQRSKDYNIINIDDPYGRRIIDIVGGRVPHITYGIYNKADIYAKNIIYSNNKVAFILNVFNEERKIVLKTPCEFNIYNVMAAVACSYIYGINMDIAKKAIEDIDYIKGRFEVLPIERDFNIIIDFAHTPEGLRNILEALKNFTQGRKIVIFGAGGNRDRTKRPEMGEIVGNYADLAIVTSDNPRFEAPEDIIEDILKGIKKTSIEYIKIVDRKKAIEYALKIASPGDTILLAGKGHEESIIIGNKKYPFREREIIFDLLNKQV